MRYLWFVILIIFSIQTQQPPAIDAALKKSSDICHSLAKLRANYQDTIDTGFASIQAHLMQKAEKSPELSQTDFGCIIDHENDAAISKQLTTITELTLKMHELEEKLEKTDSALTQNPQNVLELWNEHEIEQELRAVQKDLLESLMQLSYRQAIRTHQKSSAIRGALVRVIKP